MKIVNKVAKHNVTPEDILEGLYNNEFDVYFQPKVDALTLRPVGVEALARWRRQGVTIPADAFISAAEQYGLIAQLSETLLMKAFFGGARLMAAGYDLPVAINVSSCWFQDAHLPDFIRASLYATGLKADLVILEISETSIMKGFAQALDIMSRLHSKGFKLSIDDFAAGCTLQKLKAIPVGELKLDRAFVQRAIGNVAAHMVLANNLEMAAQLQLCVVAEGVETQAELDLVRELGCAQVQGWFIAKAMPIDGLIAWLNRPQVG